MMQPIDIALEYSHAHSPRVRSNAAIALAELGAADAIQRLGQLAREDPDRSVRREAIRRLARFEGDERAAASLLAALSGEQDEELRIDLVRLLTKAQGPGNGNLAELRRIAKGDQNAAVRWAAVEALSHADNGGSTSWPALLTAATDDADPGVRRQARDLIAQRVAKEETLDAGALEANEYRQLSDLKRAGLRVPPIKGPVLARLRLAWAARANPDIRVPFVSSRLRGLLTAMFLPFAVVGLLVVLARATITATEMSAFIFFAIGIAAFAAVAIPSLWRPAAAAADRLAGAVCELAWMSLWLLVGGFMTALLVLMAAGDPNLFRAALISVLGTTVVVVSRLASLLVYRQTRSASAGVSVQTTIATLAGWSVLLVIAVSLTMVYGEMQSWASLFFLLMPAVAALSVVSARVDSTLPDKAASHAKVRRMVAAGLLCVPALSALVFVVLGQRSRPFANELRLGVQGQYADPLTDEFDVRLGTSPRFDLDFGQVATFQAQRRELGDDLTLKILGPDRSSEVSVPVSADALTLGPAYLSKGTYFLSVNQGSAAPGSSALGAQEVSLGAAALRSAGYLARGLRRRSSAELTDGVRITATWNERRATGDDVKHAEAFRLQLLNLQKKESAGAASRSAYAVLHEDEAPFAAGAIVRSVKEPGRSSEAKPTWELVHGATLGPLRAELKRQSTVPLSASPDVSILRSSDVYRKIFAARSDALFKGVLSRELERANGSPSDTVALLEQAGRWTEATNPQRLFPGGYFVYTGGPESVPIQTGSIVRGLLWQDQQDEAGFELLEGTGTRRSEAYYWLPKQDTVLLESTWPPTNSAAAELRERYPLASESPVARAEYISRGGAAPRLPKDIRPSMFRGLSSPTDIVARAGRWIDELKVDLGSSRPPDVFQHYFMVAKDEGSYAGRVSLGSIVVGESWDDDGAPMMRVVYGWAAVGSTTSFLTARNLTYLGPTISAEALRVADRLRPANSPPLTDARGSVPSRR